MADDPNKKNPQSIFSGSQISDSNDKNDSRLASSSNKIRYMLMSRNLYDPYTEYPATNTNTATKIVNSVNSLIGVVKPFSSFNLKNSVLGRLVGDSSPLTEIGTVMLAKQFLYNVKSHISQQNLPVIKVSNLFDGSKDTNLFTKNIDLSITSVKQGAFSDILKNVLFNANTSNKYPFDNNPSNEEYLGSTGSGQLNFLYSQLNLNLYKSDNDTLINVGDKNKTPIKTRNNIVNNQLGAIVNGLIFKQFFNFGDMYFDPYMIFNPNFLAQHSANKGMANSYLDTNNIQEYAPNKDYVDDYLGTTKNVEKFSLDSQTSNEWVSNNPYYDGVDHLVWGRDGISVETDDNIDKLRGDKEQSGNDFTDEFETTFGGDERNYRFNIRGGLLEYTRNLINATEGKVGDLTRKAFLDSDGNVEGFNGSPLWKSNDSVYAMVSNNDSKTGVRQHSVVDQYDRLTKAIRFEGNYVYGGNENSVIYNSVMPRIHPTLPFRDVKNNIPNNKNMMFSIENLAINVISKGDVGIIDDEFGSEIPICEVGPFNGRIMWFPPYNLNFTETSTAKYEPTVMVGRNEPIYTYMNSERSGTVTFMLLIDYPDHLKQFHNKDNKERDISEFFAFGGDPYVPTNAPNNIEEKIRGLEADIAILGKDKPIEDPEIIEPKGFKIAFPNDVPKENDNLNNIINEMYVDMTYEIQNNLMSSDGKTFGLNVDIFTKDFIIENSDKTATLDKANIPFGYKQSNQSNTVKCELNTELLKFYSNTDVRLLYDIVIYGRTSTLGTEKYNLSLGKRRADATISFLKDRLKALFPENYKDGDIKIYYDKTGTIGEASGNTAGDTAAGIPEKIVKEDRVSYIKFVRNEKTLGYEEGELSEDDKNTIKEKQKEIENLYKDLVKSKGKAYDCVYNTVTNKTKTWNGFSSIYENMYNPAFHSQTPEDFHKRLTFLQQTVRQGAAKRYDSTGSDGNIKTVKNSVFGRQPICILRMGDFIYSKIVIDSVNIDYQDSPWDTNPEGFGMQPMIANVTLNVKYIGGQSLKGPVDALQNAATFNYYANSTFTNKGMYSRPSKVADDQDKFFHRIVDEKNESKNTKNSKTPDKGATK